MGINTDKKGRQVLLCLPSDDPQGMKELTQNMLGKRKGERPILPHCNEETDSSDGEGCSGLDERRGGARIHTRHLRGERLRTTLRMRRRRKQIAFKPTTGETHGTASCRLDDQPRCVKLSSLHRENDHWEKKTKQRRRNGPHLPNERRGSKSACWEKPGVQVLEK